MSKDDYSLPIDEVSKRLNKSVRTIHRYKDSGRLSFVVGASQGNPLFFSTAEVESLARELYPNLAPADDPRHDGPFWERLERVERVLAMLGQSPVLERLMGPDNKPSQGPAANVRGEVEQAVSDLVRGGHLHGLDDQELGRLLVHLGDLLLQSDDVRGIPVTLRTRIKSAGDGGRPA